MITTRYVALLRGINVGGHVVSMERLRTQFSTLGFTHVKSYLQTGNVFFDTEGPDTEQSDSEEANRTELKTKIEATLQEALGYEVPTFLRTISEIEDVLENAPFKGMTPEEDERHIVVFTDRRILPDLTLPCASPKNDSEIVGCTAGETFLRLRVSNGRMADPAVLMRQVFGAASGRAQGTARFYHTLKKIAAARN